MFAPHTYARGTRPLVVRKMSRANEKMHSRFVRKGGGYERRGYITFSSVVGTSTRRCYTRVYNILKRAVHV